MADDLPELTVNDASAWRSRTSPDGRSLGAAYASPANMEVPRDLAAALTAEPSSSWRCSPSATRSTHRSAREATDASAVVSRSLGRQVP